MIGVFKQKTPGNIFVLFIFGILLKLPVFFHPRVPVFDPKEGPLFRGILHFLEGAGKSSPFIYPCIAYLLLFMQAVSLNKVINDNRMMQRQTFLPAMSYLLVTSLIPGWNNFSAPLLVNSILVFVLAGLFKTQNIQHAKGTIFNVGLGIGIASFIFFPTVVFMIWAIFGLMLMRPFRINEWLLCILGMTAPYYFYPVYLFLTDQLSLQNIIPYVHISLPRFQQSGWIAASSLLLCIPFILGAYYVQDNLRRMLIQVRKGWSLILLYLLAAVLVPFLNAGQSFENWVIAAVPLAAFHACSFLYPPRKFIPLLLFWIIVAFIVVFQVKVTPW
ncbi:MAG: hypothetical protein JST09_01890 [Bacteroidetes bacterium]|nr:hypothetical protein [Bacteroidota bacterium]